MYERSKNRTIPNCSEHIQIPKREPRFCCIPVRLGLSILYTMILLFGIVIIAQSLAKPASTIHNVDYLILGITSLATSIIGLLSILKRHSKLAKIALFSHFIFLVFLCIVFVLEVAFVYGSVQGAFTHIPASDDAIKRDPQLYQILTATLVVLVLLCGTFSSFRMFSYFKWLKLTNK